VGTKWIAEINEHCPGVKIVLCALKCDLREEHEKDDDDEAPAAPHRQMVQYHEGLQVARTIGALRYLGTNERRAVGCFHESDMMAECSAMRNRGVNEAFTEAARVALQVKPARSKEDSKCTLM